MLSILTNITLFGCWFFKSLYENKRITASNVLILLYFLVAIGGINFWNDNAIVSEMSILNSLFFFLIVYIFFTPILNNNIASVNISINENSILKIVLYAYVFFAFISSKGYIDYIITSLSDGDWANIKYNAYKGEMSLPNSLLDIVARIIVGILKYAVLIYGFWCLTNQNKTFKESLFWIVMGILPSLIADLASAYRGGIFISFFLVVYFFLLFEEKIERKKRQFIQIFFVFFIIVLSALMLSISIARFEDNFVDSLFSYFGQSFINYNYGIASKIQAYSGGEFFLGNMIGLSMDEIMVDSKYGIKTNNGEDLDTFVGIMIFDYGFIFTLIISIIIAILLNKYFKVKQMDLAALFLYAFYLHFLVNGVFHFPWNYAEQCIYAYFFYMILRVSNKYSFRLGLKNDFSL